MNTKDAILRAYDRAAVDYGSALWTGLDNRPFDQIILAWFATQIPPDETVLEIGAGAGEVSGYLAYQGVQCVGTDISEKMIENDRKYFPQVKFEIQDFFNLSYENESFSGVVGFYAIVNLELEDIKPVLQEVKRVLKNEGVFLFSFHVHEVELHSASRSFSSIEAKDLVFYYFEVDEIKKMVERAGYQIVDILIRYPYPDVEHQSKRAYFVVRKPAPGPQV